MSTLANNHIIPLASKVWFNDDMMFVLLTDGREIGVPILWFPKLRKASSKQLNNYRLIGKGIGIHWDELDEDVSVEGMLTGKNIH